jgi:hypothetical protein
MRGPVILLTITFDAEKRDGHQFRLSLKPPHRHYERTMLTPLLLA